MKWNNFVLSQCIKFHSVSFVCSQHSYLLGTIILFILPFILSYRYSIYNQRWKASFNTDNSATGLINCLYSVRNWVQNVLQVCRIQFKSFAKDLIAEIHQISWMILTSEFYPLFRNISFSMGFSWCDFAGQSRYKWVCGCWWNQSHILTARWTLLLSPWKIGVWIAYSSCKCWLIKTTPDHPDC